MPSVTVKLIYTPKPDANEVRVSVGGGDYPIRFDPQYGGQVLAAVPLNTTPAEAIALARALVLVAGCADPRWRGWHWEALEQDGRLLATTPLGEWYVNREDCEKAVRTLFGDRSEVVIGPGYPMPGGAMVLVLREPTPDAAITNADDTPEADQ